MRDPVWSYCLSQKGGARNRYARYGITFARPTSETKNGPTKETTILPNLRFRIYTKITSTLQQVKSRQPHATRQHVHKMVVSFVGPFLVSEVGRAKVIPYRAYRFRAPPFVINSRTKRGPASKPHNLGRQLATISLKHVTVHIDTCQ